VHITRYPATEPDSAQFLIPPMAPGVHEVIPPGSLPESFLLHRMVMVPPPDEVWREAIPDSWSAHMRARYETSVREHQAWAEEADVLVGWEWGGLPAEMVLDDLMTRHHRATMAVVLSEEQGCCLVGIRLRDILRPLGAPEVHGGYMFTMKAQKGAPTALFGSALMGWAEWWLLSATELRDDRVRWNDLPAPPGELVVVEAWVPYQVSIEGVERTRWLPPRERPRIDWSDGPV
jgi:hypothetical protein